MDDARFLDELRPFRRGELALARRCADEAAFLPAAERDLLRYALRFAQLSTLAAPDDLLEPIDSFRLRLLQLLGPALPTDPKRLDARPLHELAPRIAHMVAAARPKACAAADVSEHALDAVIADKKVALVMGGAGGAGFVFLGAMAALEDAGITPAYQLGASIGALIAALRARTAHYDLEGLLDQAKRIDTSRLYGPPSPPGRYGLPGALRFDPRAALGFFFTHGDEAIRLRDLRIPTDALVTGLRPGALARPREQYAAVVGSHIDDPDEIAHLRPATVRRIVGVMVELAVSRRVFAPVLLGADPVTADLEAMDAAGFSAAIPALLHYDVFREDPRTHAILDHVFAEHDLVALVDGALANLLPAHLAWRQLEAGRIGTRNAWIVALDAFVAAGGRNRLFLPIQRVLAATLQRDRAYWDLYVPFRRTPFVLDIVPRPELLREAAEAGRREMERSAAVLREGSAPLPRWSEIEASTPRWD